MLPENREYTIPREEIRHLDITDLERIERFKKAGYGGNVSDSLWSLGVCDTVLSQRFKALRQGMQLVGRALPVKLHTLSIDTSYLPGESLDKFYEDYLDGREHPQKCARLPLSRMGASYVLTAEGICSPLILGK